MSADIVSIDVARSALGYALRYIGLGWHVLPLDPGTKKPLGRVVRNGFHDATNDVEVARQWWTQHPDAGIGVALRKSGLVAVDIDPRNGGIDTMDTVERQHGALESDVLALTGGGGEHRVFSAGLVENLPGTLGPGVDLKADGYIAVEPTVHPSGRRYAWESSSDPLDGVIPTTLPSWIRGLMRGSSEAAALAPSSPPPAAIDGRRKMSTLEALAHIDPNDRDMWLTVGAAIHQEMPGQDGFDMWAGWSAGSPKYDSQDQMRVWRSFRRRPLGERRVDLTMIFATAQRNGWKNDGGVARIHESPSPSRSGLILDLSKLAVAAKNLTWRVKHILPEDSIGIMFGASGSFKSFIALDLGLHVAHGMRWLGRKTKPGCVLYIAAEGGTGLMKRVRAWHNERGLSWASIPFYVIVVPLLLSSKASELAEAIVEAGISPDLVVVDTKSQTDEGEENSSTDTSRYFREIGVHIRERWKCTVLVVHHSGHSASERPRGSSTIQANTSFMFGVFRDETEMLATMTCTHIKDGEKFDDVEFSLTRSDLGSDEDGDTVTSLVATHLSSAAALVAAHQGEQAAGRSGRAAMFRALLQTGQTEKQLRHAFYLEVPDLDLNAKKQAYYRIRDATIKAGVFEFGTVSGSTERLVIMRKEAE